MSQVTPITTHVADALNRRLQEYKESNNLEQLISIFAQRSQDVEDVIKDLDTMRWLLTASGEQLDGLGRILNVSRAGYSDLQYVPRIQAAVIRYRSSGRWEQLLQALLLLTQAESVQMGESFPAKVVAVLFGSAAPVASYPEIQAGLRGAAAAGVGFDAVLIATATPLVFYGDPFPSGLGFGTVTDASVGGNFNEILF